MPTGMPSTRSSGLPALKRAPDFVGGLARPLQIEERERHHRGIERLDAFDAALQVGARRIGAIAEFRRTASWKLSIRCVAGS